MRPIYLAGAGAVLMVTACNPGPPEEGRLADGAAEASDAAAPVAVPVDAASEAAGKSIIRPEVTALPPAEPEIEPIELLVPFGERSMALGEEARSRLDELVETPALRAGGPIILRGHSDTRGHDGDNLVASRRRAEAVRAYLASKGVPDERMTVIALGETRPIAPNANEDGSDNPAGRARNRRVEVEVALPAAEDPQPAASAAPPKVPAP